MSDSNEQQRRDERRRAMAESLVPRVCLGARSPHGSILLLDFALKPEESSTVRNKLRSLNVVGPWRLETSSSILFDSERCAAIEEEEVPLVSALEGSRVTDARVSWPGMDLTLVFSSGTTLVVFGIPGEYNEDSWFVVDPE